MPLLLILLALIAPRIVLLVLWFTTSWPHSLFHTLLWPVLGLIFLPTTLLCYVVVLHWFGGHWTLGAEVCMVIALLIDLSPAGSRNWRNL